MTDVQLLLCSSKGPKVEGKVEFLLRFVYHETLIATLKSLNVVPAPQSTGFDVIMADFKKQQAFGAIAAAMHLAKYQHSTFLRHRVDKRVFKSNILGGNIGQGDPDVYETSGPTLRAKALMIKLVQ